MVKILRRIESLEQVLLPSETLRRCWVVVVPGVGPANLANATCRRTRLGGRLWEIVQLDGHRDELSEEQLQRFIESCPIQGRETAC